MDPLHRELIQQAAEAARAGEREQAFKLLEQVLVEDEENIAAWLLLARLSSVTDEKRMALTTVLQLDPNNQRAKQLLARLEGEKGAASPEADVIPGVSRRTFQLIVAGVGGFVLMMLIGIFVIINNSNQAEQRRNEQATEAVLAGTRSALGVTQTLAVETEAAFNATQTQVAIVSPTPTLTATGNAPTLPPTPTSTLPPTATPTPAPLNLPGTMLTWGGEDLNPNGASPIQLRPLNGLGDYTTIEADAGKQPFVSPDGQRIVYAAYSSTNRGFNLASIDFEGNPAPPDTQTAQTVGGYLNSQQPTISADGSRIAFLGRSLNTGQDEVFILIQGAAETEGEGEVVDAGGGLSVVQLTNDTATYSHPSISPDGTQIVAVRIDRSGDLPGVDLVLINVGTQTLEPLTTNLLTLEESMPRWSPNGQLIAFVAKAEGERTNDLYLIPPTARDGQYKVEAASSSADEMMPVWSPDGQFLAFTSDRDNRAYNIYIVNLNNQEVVQFTRETDDIFPTSWMNR